MWKGQCVPMTRISESDRHTNEQGVDDSEDDDIDSDVTETVSIYMYIGHKNTGYIYSVLV